MDRKKIILAGVVILSLIVAYSIWIFAAARIYGNRLTASGTIEATQVNLATKVTGRISEFYQPEGSFVEKGDRLCRIDSPELELTLKQATANLSAVRSQFNNSAAEYNRIKSLYEQNFASKQQFDAASTSYLAGEARLQQIQAAQQLAQIQLDETLILAPLKGVLSKKIRETGELVFPGYTLYTLSNLSDVWLLVYIPEKYIGKIKYGDTALISLDSFPQKKISGKITYIASEAEFTPKNIQTKEERIKQVFGVKISIPNTENLLKPGMPADAEIQF